MWLASPTALFQLSGITLHGDRKPRLDQVTLTISSGTTAVLGESGAGKTSLLNVLAGFERPDQGSLRRLLSSGTDRLPLYWAPAGGGFWPQLTVREHLTVVSPSRNSVESDNFADEILHSLDLAHRRHAYPGELSQGEQSRLAAGRAVASKAAILLLDEPLDHVDSALRRRCWRWLHDWINNSDTSVVFSSHDVEAVIRESDSAICLHAGQVTWQGPTMRLYQHPPNPSCGELLGRLNWLGPEEAGLWFGEGCCSDNSGQPLVLRPEHVHIIPEATSPVEVVDVVFAGIVSETVLRHCSSDRRLALVHGSGTVVPSIGARVRPVFCRGEVPFAAKEPTVLEEGRNF